MKVIKRILVFLLIVLIIIQFFHPKKNISAQPSPHDIATVYNVPENVNTILAKACNDCHSNNTRYPWYNNIQPVAWWLDGHIRDGKRGLNFSEFTTYRIGKQYHRMQDIINEVKKGDMPLQSYTIIHTDAKLTAEEKSALLSWANNIRDTMQQKYPMDSLIIKKVTTKI